MSSRVSLFIITVTSVWSSMCAQDGVVRLNDRFHDTVRLGFDFFPVREP